MVEASGALEIRDRASDLPVPEHRVRRPCETCRNPVLGRHDEQTDLRLRIRARVHEKRLDPLRILVEARAFSLNHFAEFTSGATVHLCPNRLVGEH
jgi:hypothetical protein